MRIFTKVTPSMWTSAQFKRLSDGDRLLWLYYTTGPHQTISGVSRVPDGYVAQDLGWSAEDCQASRSRLTAARMILFDETTCEVFVVDWWRDNGPENKSHYLGAKRGVAAIESPDLREAALAALELDRGRREEARRSAAENPMDPAQMRENLARRFGN